MSNEGGNSMNDTINRAKAQPRRYIIEEMLVARGGRAVLQVLDRKNHKIKYFSIQIEDDGTITAHSTEEGAT